MNRDVHLSFNSYDRFFPNQDSLPEGGFGNLVALPLQEKARRNGNSVFVDESFQAYLDQWNFLQNIQKISEATVDTIVQKNGSSLGELIKSSESRPWEVPKAEAIVKSDFPSNITLTRANLLYIPLVGLSAKVVNLFKRMAAFHNPEFYTKQGMRLSTYDIPRVISCSELEDKTNLGREINVAFRGKLREEQQDAMECMLQHNVGTLSATTAFGKTIFAIAMIAQRKVNTLILVHRESLLDQWKKQLEDFLDISEFVVEENKCKNRKSLSPIGLL